MGQTFSATNPGEAGVTGTSSQFNGVLGVTTAEGHAGVAGVSDVGVSNGVYGRSKNANGVVGYSGATGHNGVAGVNEDGHGHGVYGRSRRAAGVFGQSAEFNGVLGVTTAEGHAGVAGVSDEGVGNGVYGRSKNANGIFGVSTANGHSGVVGVNDEGNGFGVYGRSQSNVGVLGVSETHEGMRSETNSITAAAMAVYMKNGASPMPALHVEHQGKLWAAHFVGNVVVTDGDITLANADCAEDFDIAAESSADPGTVMVLDNESKLRESIHPYDKRVAGVVSGAGNYRPALVLDKQPSGGNRKPIALLGKVFCKVDAQFGPIEVGDLLTTSPTAGHAMRVDDPFKAFGAVIGKALRPLTDGQGLIPILIALQ